LLTLIIFLFDSARKEVDSQGGFEGGLLVGVSGSQETVDVSRGLVLRLNSEIQKSAAKMCAGPHNSEHVLLCQDGTLTRVIDHSLAM